MIGINYSGTKNLAPTSPTQQKETVIHTILPTAPIPRRVRVAAYARVSTDKEAMLHSLSEQVSYYNETIQNHPGWEFAGIYADADYTGTKENRPEFQRLLADCRAGKIDRIITKAVSRFARNTVTLLETVRELKALGIAVYFEEQNIDSLSGSGELMLTILASLAQEESRSVSENCIWRIRKDFYEGKPMNMAKIYGYRKAIIKPNGGNGQLGQLGQIEIDEIEAQVVRRIFSDYLNGIGTPSIAARLCEEKIPCRYGGEWTSTLVMGMLKNEKYTGDSILQKTYVQDHLSKKQCKNNGEIEQYYVEETHPAIISHEMFEAVQEKIVQSREHYTSPRPPVERYPFTGLIVCGHCGKHFRRRTNACHPKGRRTTKISWQCETYINRGKKACPAKQIPEETLMYLTGEVLGVDTVTAENIQKLREIRIPCANRVLFVFQDGHEEARTWKDRSRAESWTEEMRYSASQNAIKSKQSKELNK